MTQTTFRERLNLVDEEIDALNARLVINSDEREVLEDLLSSALVKRTSIRESLAASRRERLSYEAPLESQ